MLFTKFGKLNMIALCALSLLSLGAMAPAAWLPLTAGSVQMPAATVAVSTFDRVDLNITVAGFDRSEVTTKGGQFALLSIPGNGHLTVLGQPKLPVISQWVEIPQGAAVQPALQVIESRDVRLSDLGIAEKILPVQLPVV